MGTEVLGTESVLRLLGMVDMKCGRLRQPDKRRLVGGWVEATQETRGCEGGTEKGVVQGDEGGNMG